ncbi:Bifunctional inhibitor/plant lipid transfer protein/seed storage helical domain containing protein [Trema orientale]|uniref:Bifunctional inhibitor/plant lipid transfer protein/seed storage helical domain containing protein n=1 Tax=Trema orientale TaxID=63057 RepID=A0A2P5EZI9_TREOI|nr:Bifunctional inhibitor/plant lipid transfer protein/seed storage helical domain containing protein [Trema orientale]
MGSKIAILPLAYVFLGLALLVGFGSSDFEQDKAECADKLVALATCLPFVGGEAKNPTPDCCSGFKQVVEKSTKCLCVLIKDRNNPNLGLKINTTLALQLPSDCHAPFNVTSCIDLLHLKPGSSEAKEFEGFAKSLKGNTTTATPAAVSSTRGNSTSQGTSAQVKDSARERWQGAEMVLWTLLLFVTPHLVFHV